MPVLWQHTGYDTTVLTKGFQKITIILIEIFVNYN